MGAAEEIRNCRRKRGYASEREAEWAAVDRLELAPSAPKLRPYECSWCGSWHLSSSGPRSPQRRSPRL